MSRVLLAVVLAFVALWLYVLVVGQDSARGFSTPRSEDQLTATPTLTPSPVPCDNYSYTVTTGATVVPGTLDIGNHCDDCMTAISLPFTYNLYGVPFNGANVSSNGTLQLLSNDSAYHNACLPTPVFSYTIMVGWDDLRTDSTHCWGGRPCGIYTSVSGIAPNRIFNVEWLANCYTECMWNFEIRLYEAQERFDLIYGYMDRAFSSTTVGVQGDQMHFTQYLCNTFGDPTGMRLTFTYLPCTTGTPTRAPTVTPTRTPTFTTTPSPTRTITPTFTPAPCGNYLYTATMGATIVPGTVDIGNHCDDCTTTITLPFTYNVYGEPFDLVVASSNGNLQFLGNSTAYNNTCLPTSVLSYTIIPQWNDLRTDGPDCPGGPCGIYTSTSGSAPNRILNIEYRANCFTECRLHFEARLYEGQERFDFLYGELSTGGASSTVGVQADQTRYTQYVCNYGIAEGLHLAFYMHSCPTGTPSATPSAAVTGTPTVTATPTPSRTATPCPLPFTDVSPTDYFYEAVRYLYCRGIISGYADGTFRPYNNTTRGQLTKIVVLAFGFEIYTPPIPTFADVPNTDPFYQYIETAAFNQLVSGYSDGTFRPYNNVTRGQLCKIVVIAAGWPLVNPPTPTFLDVPPEDPFYIYIETAYEHGIISGYADGTFRPGNNATRGQITKIVYEAVIAP